MVRFGRSPGGDSEKKNNMQGLICSLGLEIRLNELIFRSHSLLIHSNEPSKRINNPFARFSNPFE